MDRSSISRGVAGSLTVSAALLVPWLTSTPAFGQEEDDDETFRIVEERLDSVPTDVTLRGEGLELALSFHGDLQLPDGRELPWDADRRRPYVRAAATWLTVLRGVEGRALHRVHVRFVAFPFEFGGGFATPLYESLVEIDGAWLPTEALVGISTHLYVDDVRDDPEVKKEHFDNAMHELGHAFGIGSLWNLGRFDDVVEAFHPDEVEREPPDRILRHWVVDEPAHGGLVYRQPAAVAAFQRVHGVDLDFVPISSDCGHLYALFDEEPVRTAPDGTPIPATEHELMSHRDVLSAISIGFLADLGWRVDPEAAQALPGLDPLDAYAGPADRSAPPVAPATTPTRAARTSLEIVAPGDDLLAPYFDRRVDVFGARVLATARVRKSKLLHAAAVLGEYLDNDEDGEPDDARVAAVLARRRATLVLFHDEREAERLIETIPWEDVGDRVLQDLYDLETHPAGAAQGRFDAALEEVLHLVTHGGYAHAYPEVFGEHADSELGRLMDAARGGRFDAVPTAYPDGAWYTYDDVTCEYGCQVAEYVYWGLTSLLGGQDFPGRREEIQHEWRLCTPAEVEAGDPGLHALLTDPRWNLPRRLPDGVYRPRAR